MKIRDKKLRLDGYNFDDYFNALISPVSNENKRQEIPSIIREQKMRENDVKYHLGNEYLPTSIIVMPSNMQRINPSNNTPIVPSINSPSNNNNIKVTKKRKSLAEATKNVHSEIKQEEPLSPSKKNKKPPKTSKKKKETPKRKRINYCFEIHRSGCSLNKDSKLYCKVFLKGKLQSEVDLIKGARGKWAYTFYDQRKKKKKEDIGHPNLLVL